MNLHAVQVHGSSRRLIHTCCLLVSRCGTMSTDTSSRHLDCLQCNRLRVRLFTRSRVINGGEGSSARAAGVLTKPSSQIWTYLESAQCLVHTAADRQVVHSGVLNDSLSVDDEQPSKSDSLSPSPHTTISNPHPKWRPDCKQAFSTTKCCCSASSELQVQQHEVASDTKNRRIETNRIQSRCGKLTSPAMRTLNCWLMVLVMSDTRGYLMSPIPPDLRSV